jgi:PAS domain S-box-containing protein
MTVNLPTSAKPAPPDAPQSTVIVIDDEPALRDLLKLRLDRAGYHVLEAGHFDEFTQVMRDCDAVLCDIILPGNDGLQVLRWIRQHFPDIPVIIMTGEPTYETAAEAIRLGAYDYLTKPIHKDELLDTVARAVQHRRLALEKERLERENEAYRYELEQRVAERTRELGESQAFLTNLTNTMADVVLSVKLPDYRIEYVNEAVSPILGYEPVELQDQPFHILYPDMSGFEIFLQKQAALFKTDQNQMRLEQLLRHKSDKSIWTEIAATYLFEAGQPTEIICVIRDITQRSLLLGVVAHELRGPLALLKGFSEVLLEDVDKIDRTSMAKYLGSVNTTVARMFMLLNELLDVTSIELGQISLAIETVDLRELVEIQVNGYGYIARKKNITLSAGLPPEPLICECDPVKIGQVMSNFIDNAIKYSEPGTAIKIRGEQQNSTLWLGVQDQGPGIKPQELQNLFKSFGRTSSRPTGGEKSTGLGLAICKKIIEAHQGEIGVHSNPQQGATFWFRLPSLQSVGGK